MGVDNFVKDVKLSHGKTVKMKIVDNSGVEIYRIIVRDYYKSSDGIILVYDITSENSFERVDYFINELKKIIFLEKYQYF